MPSVFTSVLKRLLKISSAEVGRLGSRGRKNGIVMTRLSEYSDSLRVSTEAKYPFRSIVFFMTPCSLIFLSLLSLYIKHLSRVRVAVEGMTELVVDTPSVLAGQAGLPVSGEGVKR